MRGVLTILGLSFVALLTVPAHVRMRKLPSARKHPASASRLATPRGRVALAATSPPQLRRGAPALLGGDGGLLA